MLGEKWATKRLSHNISKLVSGGNKSELKKATFDLILNEMIIHFDMLGASMEHRI
jgi:hypothetical protein